MLAPMTGLRRRIPAVDFDQGSSVPLGFVFQLPDQFGPSYIRDGFSKLVIFDHILNSQALDANHLVFVNNARRELMLVISSPILDTSMNTGNFETGFVPVLRSLLFLGMPTLGFCQPLLILSKIAGIADTFTRGKSNHRLNAKIETNHFVDHRQGLHILLYQDRDKIAVGTILGDGDRTGLSILGERSMPVDIQGSIHFCQSQCGPIPLQSVSGVGSRLRMLLFLERGVFGTSLKEVLETFVQVPERLLKRHARDICEPRILFLEVRQQSSKIVVGKLHPAFVGSGTHVESPIIDEAAAPERLRKETLLFIGRIEPILVRPLGLTHCLFAFLLLLDMLFYRGQDLSIERAIVLFCYLSYLFQQMSRKPNGKRFYVVFHAVVLTLI